MKQKAQFGSLQTIIIALVVIGIIIGIGFLILEEFKDSTSDSVATVSNEVVTSIATAGKYVAKNSTTAGINCWNTMAVTAVTNTSSNTAVTWYTYDADTGRIWNNSAGSVTSWNVSYTYQYGRESCGGVVSTIEATAEIPTWLSIVVILLIVGILLAVVFNIFPSGGMGGGFGFGRGSGGGTVAEI